MLELRKRADRSKGPNGKLYRDGAGNDVPAKVARSLNKAAKEAGVRPPYREVETYPLKHVELVGDAPAEHNFASSFVARAMGEGWLSLARGEIVLHLEGGDLRYTVVEPPGRYPTGKTVEGPDGEPIDEIRVSDEFVCELKGKG
jgi:hypothetical protein